MENVNVKVKSRATVKEGTGYMELSKAGIITLMATAGVIGAWAVVSFSVALISIGPIELVKGFFTAIGM